MKCQYWCNADGTEWTVEYFDNGDNRCIANFVGPRAHSRAVEYAYWKEHFEKEPLHVQ